MLDEIDPDDYLTPPELAKRWGVSGETVRRMIKRGQLPAIIRPSGHYLVHKDDARLQRFTEFVGPTQRKRADR